MRLDAIITQLHILYYLLCYNIKLVTSAPRDNVLKQIIICLGVHVTRVERQYSSMNSNILVMLLPSLVSRGDDESC